MEVAGGVAAVEKEDDLIRCASAPPYEAVSHGITSFWPLPRHILEPPYELYRARGTQDVINYPYWLTMRS
jgi:hypothetical protein